MSALNDLSPVAKHALWVSCMASNVPVQLADPTTVERVSSLLRSGADTPAHSKGRTSAARPPLRPVPPGRITNVPTPVHHSEPELRRPLTPADEGEGTT